MNTEDDEFNRIERESAMRMASVKAAVEKREWVGLTDADIKDILDNDFGGSRADCMRAAEAKLKEKNT